MKTRIPIELTVAVLAALSCLVAWPGLGLPVWALFIGWAWYFALGATPAALKTIYPSMVAGTVLAAICIWMIDLLMKSLPMMPSMILAVFFTVLLLMLALKIPFANCSLAAFNAYSSVFAVYYGGFFPKSGDFGHDLIYALLWAAVGNMLGPVFGFLSVCFTFPKKE